MGLTAFNSAALALFLDFAIELKESCFSFCRFETFFLSSSTFFLYSSLVIIVFCEIMSVSCFLRASSSFLNLVF